METKYAQLKAGVSTAFIDPGGYKSFVAEKERAFRRELAKQGRLIHAGQLGTSPL